MKKKKKKKRRELNVAENSLEKEKEGRYFDIQVVVDCSNWIGQIILDSRRGQLPHFYFIFLQIHIFLFMYLV